MNAFNEPLSSKLPVKKLVYLFSYSLIIISAVALLNTGKSYADPNNCWHHDEPSPCSSQTYNNNVSTTTSSTQTATTGPATVNADSTNTTGSTTTSSTTAITPENTPVTNATPTTSNTAITPTVTSPEVVAPSTSPATTTTDTTAPVNPANQGSSSNYSVNTPVVTPTVVPNTQPPKTYPPPIGSRNNITINNTDHSTARSGTATVRDSGSGGTATSGNSVTDLNIINQADSTTGINTTGSNSTTTQDNGNVNGNIVINPTLPSVPAGSTTSPSTVTSITNSTSATINNNATLNSYSGNATVTNNGNGGAATSGSTDAVANVINVINSTISNQQTYVGTVNVMGNLNGNILLPEQFINSLLSTSNLDSNSSNSANVTENNNFIINNNLNQNAASGGANVTNNGNGGLAQSGSANTNQDIINLDNIQVTSGNLLLVIVNVTGSWTGTVLGSTPTSNVFLLQSNGAVDNLLTPISVSSTNLFTINNDLTLSADSGDAAVSNNGNGGSAISGNASTSINIVNIEGSEFNLSGFFGILVINILGNWNGSLLTYNSGPVSTAQNNSPAKVTTTTIKIIRPKTSQQGSYYTSIYSAGYQAAVTGSSNASNSQYKVITQPIVATAGHIFTSKNQSSSDKVMWQFIVLGFVLAGAILVAEKIYQKNQLV